MKRKLLTTLLMILLALSMLGLFACSNSGDNGDNGDNTQQEQPDNGDNDDDNEQENSQQPEEEWIATEGLAYELSDDGSYYICTGIGDSTEVNITIAKEINNIPVTSIGDYAFSYCESLQSITIGSGMTIIGSGAFFCCASLQSITIPDGVTSIGESAFEYCSSLQYNEYDNGLYLGNNENKYLVLVKAKDTNITSCQINSNTKIIYNTAFYNCASLQSIIIPDSVTSIGGGAFNRCASLQSITIGERVTSIGSSAFEDCSSLESIVIPDSVTSIGDCVFASCSSLESITIPNSVTSIGDSAFSNCSSLQYNEYDNGLYLGNNDNKYLVLVKAKNEEITSCETNSNTKIIVDYAFRDCAKLQSITISKSVTSIGGAAFYNCASLQSIIVDENNANFSSQDGIMYNKSKTEFLCIPEDISGSITIPDGVTSLYGFVGCENLQSITIPNSVTIIGMRAFINCASLQSINYNGTTEQWDAIRKSSNWNYGTGNYTIYCVDGDIPKS